MKTAAALTCALFLCSCARYGDFRLPVLEPAPGRITWTWEVRSDPVLPRSEWGAWDSVDTLNPSVIRGGEGWLNLYSGYDGHTWHTGLARSTDGIVWTRDGKILSPA